jgi:hypothetical protein
VKHPILLAVLFVALVACRDKRPVVDPATTVPDPAAQRPEWVRSRPVTSSYYIGVGLASKARPDFQEAAKKNALNDLASEISVVVEGNSLLYTLDRKSQFDESFTSTITTRTSEQLEGFEVVDSWENGSEYWTYYRLSKSEHARIKAERKAKAIANATDLYARSRASLVNGDLRGAFDMDLRALLAMRDHWGENDVVDVDGRQVPLVNEVFTDLQRLASGVQLTILPERCELAYAGGFKRELLVSAKHKNNGTSRDLVQLPLAITYPGHAGKVTELKNTDASGQLRTTVQRMAIDAVSPEVIVRLDMDALVSKELDAALVRPLLASLTVPEKRAPVDLRMPRVFMRANETNLGQPVNDAGVSVVLREELTRRGFRFVEREQDSDLMLDLQATTRQGGESNGFHTAFLDMVFTFRDRKSGDVVHEGGRQGVKGVQLDYARAGVEAYKRANQEVRNDLVPAMLNSIL